MEPAASPTIRCTEDSTWNHSKPACRGPSPQLRPAHARGAPELFWFIFKRLRGSSPCRNSYRSHHPLACESFHPLSGLVWASHVHRVAQRALVREGTGPVGLRRRRGQGGAAARPPEVRDANPSALLCRVDLWSPAMLRRGGHEGCGRRGLSRGGQRSQPSGDGRGAGAAGFGCGDWRCRRNVETEWPGG